VRGRRARVRRRSRIRALLPWLLGVLALGLVFFAGVAIGQAIEQGPEPGGTYTRVRTIEPLTVAPAERTVTVTTAP
jgi:hypothetical protein